MLKLFKCALFLHYLVSKCLFAQETFKEPMPFLSWPNATIPFYINPDHFDHEQAMAIMTSLSMFAFKTCLKFAPVMAAPAQNQHVMTFVNPDGLKRCKVDTVPHSNYAPHLVKLGYECLQSPELDMMVMRALGFPFEHNRMSRDLYIDVLVENVEPSYMSLFSKDTALPVALRALAYDINSVMHFGERDYSKNGHRTIMFKNRIYRQNRVGLSSMDIRKIEIVYGAECLKRDRQEKIELCQSYPGVARRKREVDKRDIEVPTVRSLRVNPDITPPPQLLLGLTETLSTPNIEETTEKFDKQKVQRANDTAADPYYLKKSKISNTKKPLGIGLTKTLSTPKVEETTDKVAQQKVQRANETAADPYYLQRLKISNTLKSLGIEKEADEIIEKVYKLSASALGHARKSHCNNTNSSSQIKSDSRKDISSINILNILEAVAEYTQAVVDNAAGNLTSLCEDSDSVNAYQRECKWDFNNNCPKNYRSTNVGAVKYSTQHRPVYKQQTKHEGRPNKAAYDKPSYRASNNTELTREKRSVSPPPEDAEKITEETKSMQMEIESTTASLNLKTTTLGTETTKQPERRYFTERRYKVKNPKEKTPFDWNDSKISQESDTMKVKKIQKVNKKGRIEADREREIEDERVRIEIEDEKQDSTEDADQSKESKKHKTIEKNKPSDEDSMDSPSQDKFLESIKIDKYTEKKKNNQKSKETDNDETLTTVKKYKKPNKAYNHRENDDNGDVQKPFKVYNHKKNSDESDVEKPVKEYNQKDNGDESDVEIETTTEKKRQRKVKKIKGSEEEDWMVEKVEIEAATDRIESTPKSEKQRNRSQGPLPTTVKLSKLNQEFYNERRWPDGTVRYVIKNLKNFDLDDLRARLSEVNNILLSKTCVQLKEVKEKEADGYDDVLILDPWSPDFVTGKVGGKQIFGCVELYRGNQHRQHTAMMVMAMLGFYFEVARHDRDKYIRVHNRHIRPDKLHHFEKIRDEATLDVPYDYKSASHPAWQFWRKIGKTGISTVATYKQQDPDGSVMRSLGQNEQLLSDIDIIKINSVYGINCYKVERASAKKQNRARGQ